MTRPLLLALITAFGLAGNAFGSGNYSPPRAPGGSLRGFNRIDMLQGREFFHQKLFSTNGKFCVECHGPREFSAFDKNALQRKVSNLSRLIDICLNDPRRSGGQALSLDSREIYTLRAYLISSYRLEVGALP